MSLEPKCTLRKNLEGPGGTAHGGGDVAVFHVGSTRPQETIELGHELKGAQFDILVVWRGTGMVTHMQFNLQPFEYRLRFCFKKWS